MHIAMVVLLKESEKDKNVVFLNFIHQHYIYSKISKQILYNKWCLNVSYFFIDKETFILSSRPLLPMDFWHLIAVHRIYYQNWIPPLFLVQNQIENQKQINWNLQQRKAIQNIRVLCMVLLLINVSGPEIYDHFQYFNFYPKKSWV